ncbi:TRAP transporter substrate-binding protein [Cupriavidus plantarum]|uniref:TRAP transporter substrate-binding protein n=1 Tax=Cupriavidus plantarum TaxID=942865 RepID=UPI0015C7932D|nr:TRAP transporter substrate-binding protein [Cupriavidus plantarum]NYH99942.1 TRAP-type C4-dicarboxylate transport system substrate-binding protein [Cupriavidus plantarum]
MRVKGVNTWAIVAGLVGGLAAALGSAPAAWADTKWDLPTGYPVNNLHTENLQKLADDVAQATGGKLKIQLHPNGSLLKANEIKRGVQTGQVQMGEILMSTLANENPVFGVDAVPFLATSYGDAFKLWEASRPVTEKVLDRQGMKLLYAVAWPPQGIYANKTLTSAADMKGLKWRAYNPATSKIAELVGAQPVTIQAADLAQALATGTVNSFMSSGATGVDTKVWESVKYFYTVDAWLPKNMLVVSKKAYAALDKPTQDALLKAVADAEKRGWQVSEQKTREYLAVLSKNGMTVQPPSAQLKRDMQKVGQTMVDEWAKSAGDDGKAILDAYKK